MLFSDRDLENLKQRALSEIGNFNDVVMTKVEKSLRVDSLNTINDLNQELVKLCSKINDELDNNAKEMGSFSRRLANKGYMNLHNELLNRVKVHHQQILETSEHILAEKAKAILGDLFNHLEAEIDEEFRSLLLKAETTDESINELRAFALKRMSSGTVSGIIDSYGEATSNVLVEG